ncbi:MAG: 16S rRNA (cytidine(1402)-2'-O)-methyltransferase [Hormoscilla sp. GM7CHS1pb]|nr:16S rRNA (cytidine(1402)-2'-O)-methyltransferase [Hormoscilla sp. GM7CHS1pb]
MLYVVGTPIGNREDMTFRAVRILKTVQAIASEDTRHTGKLLQHYQITTPQVSYHEHNQQQRIPELLQMLKEGKDIALVSDAGIPTISDPGYELIVACREAAIPVVPIPGANAAITALCAAGLPTTRFVFEGFLPAKVQQRNSRLESLKSESRTIILYEAPHRIQQTLQDLLGALGGHRPIVLARELTKLHEEFWRGTIHEAIALTRDRQPKGEFTILLAGAQQQDRVFSEEVLKAELAAAIAQGISRSQASRQLAQLTNLPRRKLYQLALALPDVILPDN